MYTMECHSVIKKNEIMPYAEKCMKREGTVSSPMWNPDPTHTDIYRYTQDSKPDGELPRAQRIQQEKREQERISRKED